MQLETTNEDEMVPPETLAEAPTFCIFEALLFSLTFARNLFARDVQLHFPASPWSERGGQ